MNSEKRFWMGGYGFRCRSNIALFCEMLLTHAATKSGRVECQDFLIDLLMQAEHSDYAQLQSEIANGHLKEFRCEQRDGGNGFYALLKNGDRVVFGWRCAVNETSPLNSLKKYCRQVIHEDIMAWRDKWLARHGSDWIICPESGDRIHVKDCHVDHYEPQFQQIFEAFMTQYLSGVDLKDIEFKKLGRQNIGNRAVLPPFDWIGDEFRRHHAAATKVHLVSTPHLRLISAAANVRRKKAA